MENGASMGRRVSIEVNWKIICWLDCRLSGGSFEMSCMKEYILILGTDEKISKTSLSSTVQRMLFLF